MTDFKPGDRVAVEGTVDFAGKNVVDVVVGHPSGARQYITVAPDAPTLLARPAPALPTEPGTTGTATVRGVPGVRVMRLGGQPWRLSFWVSVSPVAGASLHPDSDLADFIPDPQPTPEPATDLCECGHGRHRHDAVGCFHLCHCTAYRPATPSTPGDFDSGYSDEDEGGER